MDGQTPQNRRGVTDMKLARYLPILEWGRGYGGVTLTNDLVAAAIVTIMLIPQSLAYAMLAGLPPEIGLYASILPIIAYALFGTSRALAVGPVAVISLMTLTAASAVAAQRTQTSVGIVVVYFKVRILGRPNGHEAVGTYSELSVANVRNHNRRKGGIQRS